MPKSTRADLDALLTRRNEHPELLAEIDWEIRDRFAETHAIFVLDMSGFSRLTMRYGITHFLAMIHRMRGLVCPLLAEHGGRVVKLEADNIFAVFPDVREAFAASMQVQRRTMEANHYLPEDWDVHVCIGLGYGEVVMIEGTDMFGNEMNLASKLGEDVAERGEILVTETAFARLERADVIWDRRETHISGVRVPYYRTKVEP